MRTSHPRFEHKVVKLPLKLIMKDLPGKIEHALNEPARAGWELVCKLDNPMGSALLFLMKRRVS